VARSLNRGNEPSYNFLQKWQYSGKIFQIIKGFDSKKPSNPFNKSGAGGDRTRDLLNAIQARSQLRHSPIYLFIFCLTGF
jgi:hypothetical protein